ncbi:lipocalin family protein [Lutimaribacter marinistellae]|uniref:Outer membrane lipoprotein Blc n=1 Tax=Lutimaribacter marinistellae TaxID=1820329 RepID=A0ABV7TLC8_9RHOB
MIRSTLTAATVLFCLSAADVSAAGYRDESVEMTTVQALDIPAYMGLWYEIARYPNSFEENCVGVTAEYAQRDDGKIDVVNTCRKGALDGPVEQAEGVARPAGPGKLSVSFVPFLSWLPFLNGDYWVLHVSDGYEMAVVGNPAGSTGWVLARSPEISQEQLDTARQVFSENGYDLTALRMVPQPPE